MTSPLATSRKKACKKVYASKMKSLRISKEACTALEQFRLDHDIETWSDSINTLFTFQRPRYLKQTSHKLFVLRIEIQQGTANNTHTVATTLTLS